MSIVAFQKPEFLEKQDANTIHKRMMETLPVDIDKTEAGFPWDFTRPTALEKAEILQFHLIETLKIMHPMWAYGRWLDYHASWVGLVRRSANAATGIVTVIGVKGTVIPTAFVFAIPAVGSVPAVEYKTDQIYEIDESGTIDVNVTAVIAGKGGNASSDVITIMAQPIRGIKKVSNENRLTGGVDAESDEDLRVRIDEANAGAGDSYVGNDADYVRWGKAVPGVGKVLVRPEWNGAGTVKVVLIDANGYPANEQITNAVYDYIISPKERLERLAPIGAIVTVAAPTENTINYAFKLRLKDGYEKESVLEAFQEALLDYYPSTKTENIVKYIHVTAILAGIDGVADFAEFTMNAASENVPLEIDEYPVTDQIEVIA